MSDLTDFLLQRIAEDEHRAGMNAGLEQAWSAVGDPRADQFHVGFSPARVLREAEAKRRIVERYIEAAEAVPTGDDGMVTPWAYERVAELKPVLHGLASIYADHLGFRDEWRAES